MGQGSNHQMIRLKLLFLYNIVRWCQKAIRFSYRLPELLSSLNLFGAIKPNHNLALNLLVKLCLSI